ncbi:MAG: tetratricopeptide repeat protein [Candidatus Obscuribacterales bacterium]|nr:tetratricopeptide repeat protein [Candidatus Obscuribacterales bacterium]
MIEYLAGDDDKARKLFEEALTKKARVFGENSAQSAVSQFNLSLVIPEPESGIVRQTAIRNWRRFLGESALDEKQIPPIEIARIEESVKKKLQKDYEFPEMYSRVDYALVDAVQWPKQI